MKSSSKECVSNVVSIEEWRECCLDFFLGDSSAPIPAGGFFVAEAKHEVFSTYGQDSCDFPAKEIRALSLNVWNSPESTALSNWAILEIARKCISDMESTFTFRLAAFALAVAIARVERSIPTTENPFSARKRAFSPVRQPTSSVLLLFGSARSNQFHDLLLREADIPWWRGFVRFLPRNQSW